MKANIQNIQEIYSEIPKDFKINGQINFNYNLKSEEDLFLDGWRNVVIPTYNKLTQVLSNEFVLIDDIVTKSIIELNESQVEDNTSRKVIRYEETIIEKYLYLMTRALSSSMGKYGSYEYLQSQKTEYDDKYKVAKGLVVNLPIQQAIEKEMLRDFSEVVLDSVLISYGITPTGTHLYKMYQLIIFRYEYAENRYNNFKGFIIDFRTKCRTLVENLEFSKLDSAFSLVDNLPNELTDAEIQTFYTNFENI